MKSRLMFKSIVIAACWFHFSIGHAAQPYQPVIDPADFQPLVDNPYFPLTPGTTMSFVENDGLALSESTIEVTDSTKIIAGVRCVVVHQTETRGRSVVEETFDWYAQSKDGAVWYFGEDTTEFLAAGGTSTTGSWQAGIDGAMPGIVMPAHPSVGEQFRQEYRQGVAEDMAQVAGVGESATVPAGEFSAAIRMKEWSPLEHGTTTKWYAKGVGVIREESDDGTVSALSSVRKR